MYNERTGASATRKERVANGLEEDGRRKKESQAEGGNARRGTKENRMKEKE